MLRTYLLLCMILCIIIMILHHYQLGNLYSGGLCPFLWLKTSPNSGLKLGNFVPN